MLRLYEKSEEFYFPILAFFSTGPQVGIQYRVLSELTVVQTYVDAIQAACIPHHNKQKAIRLWQTAFYIS